MNEFFKGAHLLLGPREESLQLSLSLFGSALQLPVLLPLLQHFPQFIADFLLLSDLVDQLSLQLVHFLLELLEYKRL